MIFIEFLATGESIGIDATLSMSKSVTNEVTEHPIEDGANITDFVIKNPKTYSIDGFLSNIPNQPQGGLLGFLDVGNITNLITSTITGGLQSLLANGLTNYVSYKWDADGYHQYADDRLQQAVEKGEEIEINAGHRGYFGPLVITSYSANWDTEHGSGIPFTIECTEITKVKAELGGLLGLIANAITGAAESLDIARQFGAVVSTGVAAVAAAPLKAVGKLAEVTTRGVLSQANDFFRGR